MSLRALSEYTFYSRYSRYNPKKKRRETWQESVARVYDMHREKYADKILANPELGKLIDFAQSMQNKKRVLASQRSLQFAGAPIFKHELKMYNCLFTHIDRPRVFQEIMNSLLSGCGVGFSVQEQHISLLPKVSVNERLKSKSYIIEDSIEGWSDAVGVLINSWLTKPIEFCEYKDCNIIFDSSLIRPAGSLIAGQFKAPGPLGLMKTLDNINAVIQARVSSSEFKNDKFKYKLRPIDCYDIIMHISNAVLSGGVRRAASLCLFSYDDKEMLTAKTGNWFVNNSHRARSNNSVALLRGYVTEDMFHEIMKSTKEFGEPGFIWLDDLDFGVNPCITGDALIDVKDHACMVDGEIISEGSEYKMPLHMLVDRVSEDSESAPFVLSFNVKEQKLEWARVTDGALTRKSADVIKLHLDDGKILKCTPDHKILTSNRGYVMAKDLTEVDDIITNIEKTKNSKLIKIEISSNEDVYDITVPGNNNFFANGIAVHNCAEISMYPKTEDGRSGFQGCNLTEINGKWCTSEENFLRACEASAIIGTLQAGYTNFNYLTAESKEIFEREALLGCSITGMMDNPEVLFNPEIQSKGSKYIIEVNERVAAMIGINPAARVCAIKPAGSTSCILGTASGIHPQHAKRYIRRVQANKTEFCLQETERINPSAVEESVWSTNKTDKVISFLCEVPPGAIVKNQLGAIELLDKVKLTQQNWVENGTSIERCVKPGLRHNVSNTITVKPDEWDVVEKYIFDKQNYFTGISLLPSSGDLDYAQAPFATVLTAPELVKEYGDASVFASGLIVDGLHAFDKNLWAACDTVLGFGEQLGVYFPKPEYPIKKTNKDIANYFLAREEYDAWFAKTEWVRRVIQFGERYFNNDVRRATYCLKHVSLWKTWIDLSREYKEIDWENAIEEYETYVAADTLGAQACSGGQCELL